LQNLDLSTSFLIGSFDFCCREATPEPPVKNARGAASTPWEYPSDVAGAAPVEEAQSPEIGNLLPSCSLFSAWLARDFFPGLIHSSLLGAAIGVGALAGDPMEVDPEQLLPPGAGTTFFIGSPLWLSILKT
jgi:hypothetical protein